MTYYFYDTETSGMDPRTQRIMQFAGIRTDEDFNPLSEADVFYVQLDEDVLPDPESLVVTGIMPKDVEDGLSQSELVTKLKQDILTPETILIGYNNFSFDDEFLRYTFYRNLEDPYEHEWADGRSRWDLVHIARMMRAISPKDFNWPVVNGKPSNRLEDLASANDINHGQAHDAKSDVEATIGLAKRLRDLNPKIFNELLKLNSTAEAKKLFNTESPQPLIYTSYRIPSDFAKASLILPLCQHPERNNYVLAWDLRVSPREFLDLSVEQLTKRAFANWHELKKLNLKRLPVMEIALNKAPTALVIDWLDKQAEENIKLTAKQASANQQLITSDLVDKLRQVYKNKPPYKAEDVEAQLYDSFIQEEDRPLLSQARRAKGKDLAEMNIHFKDKRYSELFFRYKARNALEHLSHKEKQRWQQYKLDKLNNSDWNISSFRKKLEKLNLKKDQEDQFEEYLDNLLPYQNNSLF